MSMENMVQKIRFLKTIHLFPWYLHKPNYWKSHHKSNDAMETTAG